MSVPKSKRTHGHLEMLTKARELKKYTLIICTNEKNFPKRYRWCLTNDIVKETNEICRLIVSAEAVHIENKRDVERRIERNKMAYELTEVLLEDIDSAYDFFKLASQKVEYWTTQVLDLQLMLKERIKSDREKYKGVF